MVAWRTVWFGSPSFLANCISGEEGVRVMEESTLGLETVRLAVERYPDSRFWVEVGGRGGEVEVEVGEAVEEDEDEFAREAARALFLSFLAAFLIWDLLSPAV
jgi:hypothetical protein